MPKKPILKPGETVPQSGQYELRGQRGGSQGREATLVKNEPAPPTPARGMTWKLADRTRHKRN